MRPSSTVASKPRAGARRRRARKGSSIRSPGRPGRAPGERTRWRWPSTGPRGLCPPRRRGRRRAAARAASRAARPSAATTAAPRCVHQRDVERARREVQARALGLRDVRCSRRARPASLSSRSPSRTRKRVVLPPPLGPSTPTTCPCARGERHAGERLPAPAGSHPRGRPRTAALMPRLASASTARPRRRRSRQAPPSPARGRR